MTQPEGQFGKYQLLERIATGGMAEIYRARFQAAAGVTKPVVIKKILPHYAGNKNFVAMFINEAKIAVGLSHGNIAQVFDFGEIDGDYYLAMEFVHGQPLSRVLRKARGMEMPTLPPPVAVMIAMEMCKGLHYAHTRLDERGQPLNIIHRDVSPQNVIISYEGQVKIVDFGIAKARNAGQAETESGAVKGKYVYFSPEQARGRDVDARTDVFATGVVLYEMLCGKLPFEGKMMDVLGRIIRGEFPRPRVLNGDLSAALERIVLNSMTVERSVRYASAQAFQEALAGYLYSNAPTFSSSSLEALMSYLFEKELIDEGIPVKLPPNFMQQLTAWRAPPAVDEDESTRSDKPSNMAKPATGVMQARPRSAGGGTPPPVPDPPSSKGSRNNIAAVPRSTPDSSRGSRNNIAAVPRSTPYPGTPAAVVTREDVPVPAGVAEVLVERPLRGTQGSITAPTALPGTSAGRSLPRWLFVALPLAAMIASGGMVYGLGSRGRGITLAVTSTPPGAVVLVDGRPSPQRTPMRVKDLPPGEHVVEVQLPRMKHWARRISEKAGSYLLEATLEPADGAPGPGTAHSPQP